MYRSIQLCRAIAAVMVMLLHMAGVIASAKYFGLSGIDAPFSFGKAGVEFFFVLSGFIITFVHWNDFGYPSRLANYGKKRAIRIYPTYWMIFAAVYLVAAMTLGNTVILTPAALIKALLLLPQASPDPVIGTFAPILGVAWSLQYEVLFYVLMAVYVVSVPLGGLISVAILANLFACRAGLCVASAPYLQTDFVLLFGLGALTAIFCKMRAMMNYSRALAGVGVFTFLITALWNDVTGERLTLSYGAASAAIIVGLVKAEEGGKLKISWGWPTLLGDASYALYLIHYPLILMLSKISIRIGLHGLFGSIVSAPVIIAACIASAIGFHRFVERPLLRTVTASRKGLKVAIVRS